MLLTVFLAVIFCAAVTLMMISEVAFIQEKKFFSSAPREAREVIKERDEELFYGARIIGWALLVLSILMIVGAAVIGVWDGVRSQYSFLEFFIRFVLIFTIYKVYDMVWFDYFWLLKFKFFQFYYPEVETVFNNRKYGFNLKSQLLKLFILFPAISALAAWVCSLFTAGVVG